MNGTTWGLEVKGVGREKRSIPSLKSDFTKEQVIDFLDTRDIPKKLSQIISPTKPVKLKTGNSTKSKKYRRKKKIKTQILAGKTDTKLKESKNKNNQKKNINSSDNKSKTKAKNNLKSKPNTSSPDKESQNNQEIIKVAQNQTKMKKTHKNKFDGVETSSNNRETEERKTVLTKESHKAILREAIEEQFDRILQKKKLREAVRKSIKAQIHSMNGTLIENNTSDDQIHTNNQKKKHRKITKVSLLTKMVIFGYSVSPYRTQGKDGVLTSDKFLYHVFIAKHDIENTVLKCI